MRGTKARAIRKAQKVCDHEPRTDLFRAPKQVRYVRCAKCGAAYHKLVPVDPEWHKKAAAAARKEKKAA